MEDSSEELIIMKDFFKFIKSSGIYFVGSVLTKLISFILLPMYTSYINPTDYGTYDLYISYITFLCSVLFLDIWNGIMRFMFDYEGDDKKKAINSGTGIFLISCLLYTIIIIIVNQFMHVEYVQYLFLYGLLMNLQILMGYIARGYGKNVLYAASGLVGSIITIIFNVVLLVVAKMDYSALYIASCIGYVVNILIIIIGLKMPDLFSLKHFDKKIFKELLLFSLPLCVNSVAYWFLTSYNKIALANQIGTSANGLYAIASRFGSMISLFTSCFQMAWQELAFSKTAAQDGDLGKFYSVAIDEFIKVLGVGLTMLVPMIYIIYPYMIADAYSEGKELVPFYLLATLLSTLSGFIGNIFGAIKNNKIIFVTTLTGSIVNVVSVHMLIPVIGAQAANIALILGFFINILIRLLILKKELSIKITKHYIVIIAILFGMSTVAYFRYGMLQNIVVFLICAIGALILLRDEIKEIVQKIPVF